MSESDHTVYVDLGSAVSDRSYTIEIGRGFLADAERWQTVVGNRGVVLVTDDQVGPIYLHQLKEGLSHVVQVTEVVLPSGERHKHLRSIELILDAALQDRHERQSLFIALGGGVIGDMTGFAAACFLRGADFLQVPTTLLAQVDSSVGGKTGVNHAMGKNLIGAFHQPRRVMIDLDTLLTLPEREYAAGLAEVVKYGLISDSEFFDWLVLHRGSLKNREMEKVAIAVKRSCEIKAAIVAADEREAGVRAHLNFGHTFGHAIERLQGYGDWLHGEAVAAGMVMAARISAQRGDLAPEIVQQLIEFNQAVGLPSDPPVGQTATDFIEAMSSDKKVSAGKIRYILLRGLGAPWITDGVTVEDIARVIAA
jgi:3-dehydroquinate synthase